MAELALIMQDELGAGHANGAVAAAATAASSSADEDDDGSKDNDSEFAGPECSICACHNDNQGKIALHEINEHPT